MNQRLKEFLSAILCIILVCSFFSCAEKKELQVHFYEESVLARSEDSVVVIGTDIPELDTDIIDTLVIPDGSETSAVDMLMQVYDVETVYIPDDEELYGICSSYDSFVVRVEGSMSFGIGGASVSVTAGQSTPSLITRITLGEDRLLICGNMDEKALAELKAVDTGSFGYIALTDLQKDIAEELLNIYTPHTLIFTGTEPYIDGYEVTKESITLKE